jgi:DNA-binding protein Fis
MTDWNLGKAADILGIHRNTLRLKMKEYGIERVNG